MEPVKVSHPEFERERELFLAALERTTEAERIAFLDGACGQDAALKMRLMDMLRFHGSDNFLEAPAPEAAQMATDSKSDICGTLIGRYKLLQKIGEGGMGVVYMAEQQEPVIRKVAIKIIKYGMDSKQVVARFEAERQALALMDHPHIAKVLDGGITNDDRKKPFASLESKSRSEHEHQDRGSKLDFEGVVDLDQPTGRPYFVMELVQGVPITEFCQKNRLSTQDRIRLFIPVCQAIQHAHHKGIIHRDLKPSNVLVTLNDGVPHPMVIDFGVAKALNQRLTEKTLFTQYATMIGTPAYMSPEQAEMSRLDVDTRSDIYSLGALLYELLTGSTPFSEERLRSVGFGEMQRIIAQEEPERPSTRLTRQRISKSAAGDLNRVELSKGHSASNIDSDLDWIVLKCLEKDRSRRYETANGLTKELERFLGGEAILARPPSVGYRLQKAMRRHKLAFGASAAIVVTLVVGFGVAIASYLRERAAHTMAESRRLEAETAREAQVAASKLAEERSNEQRANLIRQYVANGSQRIEQGDILSALPWWVEALRLETDPVRAEKHRIRLSTALRQSPKPTRLWMHNDRVTDLVLSPSGELVASASRDKTTRVWNLETGNSHLDPLLHSNVVEQLSFSPNGQQLLTREMEREPLMDDLPDQGEGAIHLWDVASGKRVFQKRFSNVVRHAEYSPDGKQIVAASSDDLATVWSAIDHSLVHSFVHPGDVTHASFSPDGKLLATSCKDEFVRLWDLTTGTLKQTWEIKADTWQRWNWKREAIFTSDSKRVIAINAGLIRAWDVHTNTPTFSVVSSYHNTISLDVSPGHFVTSDMNAAIHIRSITNGVQIVSFKTMDHYSSVRSDVRAHFAPDRVWLASFGQHGLQLWHPDGGHLVSAQFPVASGVSQARFSPDRRYLILACGDGSVRVWDLTTTDQGRPSFYFGSVLTHLRLSRDGERIYSSSGRSQVGMWHTKTGRQLVEEFPRHQGGTWGVSEIEKSPDDRFLFAADRNGGARVYDSYTGQAVGPFLSHGKTNALVGVFPGAPNRLITGDSRGSLRLWDFVSGKVLHENQTAHAGVITTIRHIPGTALIATSSADASARVWDASTLEPYGPPLCSLYASGFGLICFKGTFRCGVNLLV